MRGSYSKEVDVKEKTLFRVRLLEGTAYNDKGDILKVIFEDELDIYYCDSFKEYCYLEKFNEGIIWKRIKKERNDKRHRQKNTNLREVNDSA